MFSYTIASTSGHFVVVSCHGIMNIALAVFLAEGQTNKIATSKFAIPKFMI